MTRWQWRSTLPMITSMCLLNQQRCYWRNGGVGRSWWRVVHGSWSMVHGPWSMVISHYVIVVGSAARARAVSFFPPYLLQPSRRIFLPAIFRVPACTMHAPSPFTWTMDAASSSYGDQPRQLRPYIISPASQSSAQ